LGVLDGLKKITSGCNFLRVAALCYCPRAKPVKKHLNHLQPET
jgi:hypothetical protein